MEFCTGGSLTLASEDLYQKKQELKLSSMFASPSSYYDSMLIVILYYTLYVNRNVLQNLQNDDCEHSYGTL